MYDSWAFFFCFEKKLFLPICIYVVLNPVFYIEPFLNFLKQIKFELFTEQKLWSVKLKNANISDIFFCSSVIEESKQWMRREIFVPFMGKVPLAEFEKDLHLVETERHYPLWNNFEKSDNVLWALLSTT